MLRPLLRLSSFPPLFALLSLTCERKQPPPAASIESREFLDRAWVRTRTYEDTPFFGFAYIDASAGPSIKGEPIDDCAGHAEQLNHRPRVTLRVDGTRPITAIEPADLSRCGLLLTPTWMVDFERPTAPPAADTTPVVAPTSSRTADADANADADADADANANANANANADANADADANAYAPEVARELETLLTSMNRMLGGAPVRRDWGHETTVLAVCGIPPAPRIAHAVRRRCEAPGTVLLLQTGATDDAYMVLAVDRLDVDGISVDVSRGFASIAVGCAANETCIPGWSASKDDATDGSLGSFSNAVIELPAGRARGQRIADDLRRVLELAAQTR